MKETFRKITLPTSGGMLLVRKISQRDFINAGKLPVFLSFVNEKRRTAIVEGGEEKLIEAMTDIFDVMLTTCAGKVTFPDGSVKKIVRKPFDDCAENELSIDVLDQADATAIVDAVQELSGMTKGAAQAAASFPEKQNGLREPAPNGDDVSRSADGPAEAQPVGTDV